jgi:hypothetical protein
VQGHEFADLIGSVVGRGREADVASWKSIQHLTRNLDGFRPGVFRGPAVDHAGATALNTLSSHPEWDEQQVRGLVTSIPKVFGDYRSAVTDFEASEAAKLETLAWALRKLAEIKTFSTNPGAVEDLESRLGAFLWSAWKIKSVPMTGDVRPAAARKTRRYDLLPATWRFA